MLQKFGAILILFTIVLYSGCMSMGLGTNTNNLSPGQIVSDDKTYISGRISIDIPQNDLPPEPYRTVILGLKKKGAPENESAIIMEIKLDEIFYKSLDKGVYEIKSISYFLLKSETKPSENNFVSINIRTEQAELDLSDTDFAYLGDIKLTGKKNQYNNPQRTALIINDIENHQNTTSHWLFDEKGNSVPALDISDSLSNMVIMESSFPTNSIGYKMPRQIEEYINYFEDTFSPLTSSDKIAFVSIDNNFASWKIVNQMEDYARKEFDAATIDQALIESTIMEYPTSIYVSNSDVDIHRGSIRITESFDDSFDTKAIKMANELGVDKLYILYHITGISYDSYDPKNKKMGLVLNLRGRLYSTDQEKCIGESIILKDSPIPLLSISGYENASYEAEVKLYDQISKGIVEALYNR